MKWSNNVVVLLGSTSKLINRLFIILKLSLFKKQASSISDFCLQMTDFFTAQKHHTGRGENNAFTLYTIELAICALFTLHFCKYITAHDSVNHEMPRFSGNRHSGVEKVFSCFRKKYSFKL